MKYVVDTHALIWFLAGDARLGKAAEAVLSDPESELILPATALAEVCWIVERRAAGLTAVEALAAIDSDPRIAIYPLDREVVERSIALTVIGEMHDRQIVATATLLMVSSQDVALLSRDENITASKLVPIVWD